MKANDILDTLRLINEVFLLPCGSVAHPFEGAHSLTMAPDFNSIHLHIWFRHVNGVIRWAQFNIAATDDIVIDEKFLVDHIKPIIDAESAKELLCQPVDQASCSAP